MKKLVLAFLASVFIASLSLAEPPKRTQEEMNALVAKWAAETKGEALVLRAPDDPVKPPPPKKGRGYKPLTPEKRKMYQEISRAKNGGRLAMMEKFQTLPAAFDCRDKGWVTPIGDQGQCGSCYLYSTVQTASAAFVKAGYGKPDGSLMLSVQFGMDCHDFGGCDGGNGTEVIDWMVKNGFPASSWVDPVSGKAMSDYPAYTADVRQCRLPANAKIWKPADWGFVSDTGNPTVTAVKTAIYNFGTLNLALDADGQFMDGTGTITSLGTSINHEIQCIAWDDAKDGGAFLLQNQWDTSWGINGYRWITYKAAGNIVDWFWVTANPLPPPPPGPTPPPPTPGNITITLTNEQVQSVISQSGGGLPATITIHPDGTWTGPAKPPTMPKAALSPLIDDRWAKQELINKEILDALKALKK